ncbi:hypothetical protein P691DRAFT_765672 [Macrolepiota fuliginosa MF-IS2]|uniref:Uncharacterized protein n=1 Tax=Macrolepiota fuliginosa MF-IS2 TaxID=1400762 RepID=A0A9P5X0Z7_9AGAR|nr:hypothetical protein P691DRAFT_765672 [Macrolepiota fuliginosa MF-IS2]
MFTSLAADCWLKWKQWYVIIGDYYRGLLEINITIQDYKQWARQFYLYINPMPQSLAIIKIIAPL